MSISQRNEFDLSNLIKSKQVKRENRDLSKKEKKYIILYWPIIIIQNNNRK